MSRYISVAAASVDASGSSVDELDNNLTLSIDNSTDKECTVLRIEGQDRPHLLMTLSGALTTAGFLVLSADISNHDGRVLDVFHIQTEDKAKVREAVARGGAVRCEGGRRGPWSWCWCWLVLAPVLRQAMHAAAAARPAA